MNLKPILSSRRVAGDTWQFGSYLPVAPQSLLAVNSFFVNAEQPLLVDTGIAPLEADYLEQLNRVCPLSQLRWIFLTHMDPDHVGNLAAVIEAAPQARVITNFLGSGKLALLGFDSHEPMIVEPGAVVDLGDRELQILQVPTYDAPETLGCFDTGSRALFTGDCFGALVPRPLHDAGDLSRRDLLCGMHAWSEIDTPWLAAMSASDMLRRHADFFALRPSIVLSGHLAPLSIDHRALFTDLMDRFALAA
jgi:glyoxylase-like metal-dependent hydrolase (beta-lactamase superfamily II)